MGTLVILPCAQTQETNSINIDPCAIFPYGSTYDFWISLTNTSAYCFCGPAALQDTALGPVTLQGVSKTITNHDGCPGVVGPQDLTSEFADLVVSSVYILNYTVLNCSSSHFSVISTAWIDWNQNFQFDDWEQITPSDTTFGEKSVTFKVPVSTPTWNVKAGRTRLRVQVQEATSVPIQPCAQFAYGGTKDFSILVSGPSWAFEAL